MNVLLIAAFVVVAVAGTAVVVAGDPLRQTIVLGIYGFALTAMFFVLQAPDVALSEIVVSGVGLPVIILAALRKLGEQERRRQDEEHEE